MEQEQKNIPFDNDVFITKLTIENVRHLKNVEIVLSETERKPLILTGRNGSGKTSVLLTLKGDFHAISIETKNDKLMFERDMAAKDTSLSAVERLQQVEQKIQQVYHEKLGLLNNVKSKNLYEADVQFSLKNADIDQLKKLLITKKFFVSYFEATRQANFQMTNGPIRRTDNWVEELPSLDQKIGSLLTEYMVSLDYERLRKERDGDVITVQNINEWFEGFEKNLQDIFADKSCKLSFDDETQAYKLILTNRQPISFNELSDGYSALLSIVGELLMRTQYQEQRYNAQGVVLIDEIEAHLHIELQKIVLPFLMRLFPRIQFIVTTHSPFVLNSVDNAVVFDLEYQKRVEDLSAYSINAIIKAYFGQKEYSQELERHLAEFEELVKRELKENLGEQEFKRLTELEMYFDNAPKNFLPDLKIRLNQIESMREGYV